MAWDQLSINKPHLVYIILGGFTSLFMLCSSVIKERLYIGEATVATICGIIFGPHAANLIDPFSWGNTDQITLEFSRIVLVVQCFAVGVELPKAYMERHWRSVTLLLIPVMTFGWLITSLFIWALFHGHLNWLDSLIIAACVTATDPVLASSVVGKGKFAKRVPKHLRDLLSAESGCNDGMAFPFIYLGLYIYHYRPDTSAVFYHWFCYTVLYECLFGAFFGVCVGYIARRAIRSAHEKDLIDRESFLVFYFVLALFCAGSGSLLGLDDLLVGFACGVGFSNDGWFTEKTEESHVSNVIDLLINLAFFVYFGTIIPWETYNSGNLGMDVWKLVVIALLVLFFRRIPIMLALKPIIPDIKTWREAVFAGHFGPIGVGAIFVAILARAELETDTTTPITLAEVPTDSSEYNIIYLIWPITTFLVVTSIVVHGSSIAVFTLGKHINTLTLTMSYTQANDNGQSWMDRLPRIQSRSRSSMSAQSFEDNEKSGNLLPIGAPGTFLRRQKEEDNPSRNQSRTSSRHRSRRSRQGFGGPISQSAIAPISRREDAEQEQPDGRASDSDTLAVKNESPDNGKASSPESERDDAGEIFEEGQDTVYEDEEGNVLAVEKSREEQGSPHREKKEARQGRRLMHQEHADESKGVAPIKDEPSTDTGAEVLGKLSTAEKKPERPGKGWRGGLNRMTSMTGEAIRKRREEKPPAKSDQQKEGRGPARAYQYGNTIIVEDEDGEVIKKYEIPVPDRKQGVTADPEKSKLRIGQMSKMLGLASKEGKDGAGGPSAAVKPPPADADDDENLRFTISAGGQRMSKAEFIDQIRQMDPKSRVKAVENSDAPEAVKKEARKDAREQAQAAKSGATSHPKQRRQSVPVLQEQPSAEADDENLKGVAQIQRENTQDSNDFKLVNSAGQSVPVHNVSHDLRGRRHGDEGETAAERRRRVALESQTADDDSDDDGTERVPPVQRSGGVAITSSSSGDAYHGKGKNADASETAAERRRREGALGISNQESDSEEEGDVGSGPAPRQNIRFADEEQLRPRSRITWGKNTGR